jgi:hypothetical protein
LKFRHRIRRRKGDLKYLFFSLAVILTLTVVIVDKSFAHPHSFTETELQQRFADSVQSLPEVIQASWQSELDLWVYADGVSKEGAQELAQKVIILSQTEFGQGLCVHVHNGNYEPIANKCSST